MQEPFNYYSRDFSQRVISALTGEKEISQAIDFLSSGSPNLKYVLIKKANEYLETNNLEKCKIMNSLIKEYQSLVRTETIQKKEKTN